MHEPAQVGDWWQGWSEGRPGRVMLGLGVGHAPNIASACGKAMAAYLDGLDLAGVPSTASWKWLGFTDEDITSRSDRLVDGLFVWGTPQQLGARLKAHLDASADHVALPIISGPPGVNDPAEICQSWRNLAPVVAGFCT